MAKANTGRTTVADLEVRLSALEAVSEERWSNHEKRAEEIWKGFKDNLKDNTLRLQMLNDQYLTQPAECMKTVDEKVEKQVKGFKKSFWTILTFIFVGVPTLLFAIFQLAQLIISKI